MPRFNSLSACDYKFRPELLKHLTGISLMPIDLRLEMLQRLLAEQGQDGLLEAFAQFIGMANSVVENVAQGCVQWLAVDKGIPAKETDRLNFASIAGALNGRVCPERLTNQKFVQRVHFDRAHALTSLWLLPWTHKEP